MRFFKPTWLTVFPPVLLVAFSVLPVWVLGYTVYALLAIPLWPLIERLGWFYHDKPSILTHPAAILAAGVWALPLFLLLCILRYCFEKLRARGLLKGS